MSLSNEVKGIWREHKGVDIAESERNKWATEGVQFLADDPNEYVAYSISGNRFVITVRDDTGIEVFDCIIQRKMRF
jgi:hypothetical protein